MEQPKRVREADTVRSVVSQLLVVVPKLNAAAKMCPNCKRRHDENFTDAELVRRLTRIGAELTKVADILAGGVDLLQERAEKKRANRGGKGR